MCSTTTTTTSISLPIALVILILAKVYAFIVMSAFQKITYNVILKFKKILFSGSPRKWSSRIRHLQCWWSFCCSDIRFIFSLHCGLFWKSLGQKSPKKSSSTGNSRIYDFNNIHISHFILEIGILQLP